LDPRAELTDALIEQVMIDAETTTELALEIIDRLPEGRPYFLWVHYLDPHWPYFPKQPWMADYFGERDRPDVLQLTDDPLYGRDIVRQREAFEIEQGSTVLEYLIACYDSEISFTDRAVGELLGRLPGAEDAVVVLTADHGEAFLEHDNLGHRSSLYREEVRVPLILRAPDGRWAGETRRDTVSLLDLYPTLVELAGDPPATPAAQRGESLLRVLDGRQRLSPVFAELTDLDGRDQVAVGDGRYKLIVPCQGCAPELYDVRADPAERRNLAGSEREARQHLEQLLAEWFDAVEWTEPGAPAQEVAPDIRRQLESLGYLDR
jgi:arylsulfatase A-like enzyme